LRPGSGVGLGDCSQVCPRKAGFYDRHVRHGGTGVFGVAAVDCPAQPAHQCRYLRPRHELTAGARLDQTHAFDAADVGDLRPLSLSHVKLSMVEAERLDLNDHMAVFWFGLGNLANDEYLRPTESRPKNCPHGMPPSIARVRNSEFPKLMSNSCACIAAWTPAPPRGVRAHSHYPVQVNSSAGGVTPIYSFAVLSRHAVKVHFLVISSVYQET
jgi:hypothetical protein